MALRVALCLLSFLLLLIINGQPNSARDMKLQQEQVEEKEVNQPYLDGWLKNTQPEKEKLDHNSNAALLDGWLKNTQDGKQKSTHNSNPLYPDGWLKNTPDRQPKSIPKSHSLYLDGWLKNTQDHQSKSIQDPNPLHLDGWLKNTQDDKQKSTHSSNPVYLDRWLKNTQDGKQKPTHKPNPVYLDGWLKNIKDHQSKSIQDSNPLYLDGWLKNTRDGKQNSPHRSDPVYLDGWLKNTQDGSRKSTHSPVYLDGWLKNNPEGNEKGTHKSNQVYLDGWLKDNQDQRGKATQKLNQVYLDGWLKDTRDKKEKTTHNSNKFLDGWLKDTQDETTQDVHNSNQVYLDGWLKDSHTTTSKKSSHDLAYSKGKQFSKVDHTEAFKLAFFTLDDLYVGNAMTLEFPIREYFRFLPRKQADAIPFSKSQVPSLLQLFSLTEDSPHGEDMKDIIDQCEFAPTKGETKACPTSLESMVEFVQSVLGAEAKYNIHTTSYPTTSGARLQNYTVLGISEDIYAPNWVACHPRPYPYGLYYCHYLDIGSKVFKVLLGGEYGDIMDALGICHLDTSDMDPNHILFRYLGMKPGDAPLCHFFPVKHLLWVPLAQEATA